MAARIPVSDNLVQLETPLSPLEERKWNRISEQMNYFHTWFKQEFNTLYDLADGTYERRGYSLPLYLRSAQSFDQHLTKHHTHEERLFFPRLAKKMPQFNKDYEDAAHLESHRGIHEGLVRLEKLVDKWLETPSSYSPTEMRECLDSFRDVLFHHLDEEVNDLKGENLRKYFTLQEYERILIR